MLWPSSTDFPVALGVARPLVTHTSMKTIIRILFFAIIVAIGTGYYFIWTEQPQTGHRIIGFAVLGLAFVLMPLFLIHRYKGKNLRNFNLFKGPEDDKNAENQ